MRKADDILAIVGAANALTRIAAVETHNDAPAAQWRALKVLEQDGPQRIGALAAYSRTTQPGMTRLVGHLVDEGLVTRGADPDDSRATVVAITEPGVRAFAEWKVQLTDALEPLFADLDDDDWAVLSRAADILTSRTAPVEATSR
jgi:DNA-binding MarR family transcriptional regulator